MIKDLYLICGVPGAGKTWVCKQLVGKYAYVPHDSHLDGTLIAQCKLKANTGDKPLVTECPFGETVMRAKLIAAGFTVHPVFIVEPLRVVKERYESRKSGQKIGQGHATRAVSIEKRAKEWNAPYGTSQEILEYLNGRRG